MLKCLVVLWLEGMLFVSSGLANNLRCISSESQECSTTATTCVCRCRLGYYQLTGAGLSACARVKTFAGRATFVNFSSNSSTQRDLVQDALQMMFEDGNYFIAARLIQLFSNNLVASFELLYKNSLNVNVDYINSTFRTKNNCSQLNNIVVGNTTLDLGQSCRTAVLRDQSLLCSSTFQTYCDSTSTSCVANGDGYVTCLCKTDFLASNTTYCQPAPKTCLTSRECNQPFGSCVSTVSGVSYCGCTWGVSGTSCEEAWLLIFVIVTPICAVIIICLVAVVMYCWRKNRRQSEASTPTFNPTLSGPKFSFSEYPPGVMRARLPDSSPDSNVTFAELRDKMASSSIAPPEPKSAKTNLSKYTYFNHAFEGHEQIGLNGSPSKNPPTSVKPSHYF